MCAGPSLPQLQVGVEFEASTRMQDTSASFGYQLDLPKANFLFKGKEDLSFPPGKQARYDSAVSVGNREVESMLREWGWELCTPPDYSGLSNSGAPTLAHLVDVGATI